MVLNFLKCYEICDIYLNENSSDGLSKETVLNFDSINLVDEYRDTNLTETLCLNLTCLERQFNSYSGNPEVRWSHAKIKFTNMKLVYLFFQAIKVTHKKHMVEMLKLIIKYFKGEYDQRQTRAKMQEIIPSLTDKTFDRIMQFFNIRGSILECKKQLEVLVFNNEVFLSIF